MSSSLRRVIVLSLAALAATVTSCSSSAGAGTSTPSPTSTPAAQSNYPFTIQNCGRTYTYTPAPTRVLAGWPKTVETLTALGVDSTLIGYLAGKFGPAPQGSTVKALTPEYAPSAETILTAKPDFFLANGDTNSAARKARSPRTISVRSAPTPMSWATTARTPKVGRPSTPSTRTSPTSAASSTCPTRRQP